MENKVVKREFSYSDDFTNEVIVCAIKNLEKSSDEFNTSYNSFCNNLEWLINSINSVRNKLLPSEIKNLIRYIDCILGTQYNEFLNNYMPFGWQQYMNNLSTICVALKGQLKDEYNEEDEVSNPNNYKPTYLDFVNFIYNNLSTKPTQEEKKIIEDKFKEFSDYLDDKRFDVLEDNPFSEIKY